MLQICKDGLKIISSCYTFRYRYTYISKDYWNLPDGQRAELIDGQFYNMAPPSRIHQEISYQISRFLGNKIVGLSLDADTEGEGSRYEQRITESHVFFLHL